MSPTDTTNHMFKVAHRQNECCGSSVSVGCEQQTHLKDDGLCSDKLSAKRERHCKCFVPWVRRTNVKLPGLVTLKRW